MLVEAERQHGWKEKVEIEARWEDKVEILKSKTQTLVQVVAVAILAVGMVESALGWSGIVAFEEAWAEWECNADDVVLDADVGAEMMLPNGENDEEEVEIEDDNNDDGIPGLVEEPRWEKNPNPCAFSGLALGKAAGRLGEMDENEDAPNGLEVGGEAEKKRGGWDDIV